MPNLPDSVSIVMRSYNEAWAIAETLKQVYQQDYTGEIELIVIDSGSTDNSHSIIQSYHPQTFIILEPGTYVPGVVLNKGFQLASHEWVVFLNSDATPKNNQWLSSLLKAAITLKNPGALFSRQVPRHDCLPIFALDYARCFGPKRVSKNWEHFFSMVSCIAPKSLGLTEPIREDLQYAEDDDWTRRLKAKGYAIEFVPESVVIHSHNYTPKEAYKRTKEDAYAIAHAGHAGNRPRAWFRDVLLMTVRDSITDTLFAIKEKSLSQISHNWKIRYQQRLGRTHGHNEALKKVQHS